MPSELILKGIDAIVNLRMAKKRKTREQKIIARLRRKLASQKIRKVPLETKTDVRQEAIYYREKEEAEAKLASKKPDDTIFYYHPKLVKKDALKTLVLALIITSLEVMLYLKLR